MEPSVYRPDSGIRNKPGYSPNEVIENIKNYLTSESIDVKKALTSEQLPYRAYMKNAQKQLTVGSIFLPVFFYSVTMIIIGLFMNQIIKAMTPDIGIMTSIGVGKKSIIAIFLIYAALMGALAGILGCFVGFGINYLLTGIMIKTYSIPVLTYAISPGVTIGAIVALIIFAELATFLSCLAIFKITPKDAVISNEAKRKKNPKVVEKIIEKSPMNIKLGLNSIFQNPKRFFVSIFSMFASFVLTMLCCNFYVAKEAMIDQAINHRLNYDCQVYMQEVSDQATVDSIKNQENVTAFEDCYYTYLSVSANNNSFYVETLAANPTSDSGLIVIPNKNGVGSLEIPEKGILLPKTDADRLKVKIGDMVTIGGKSVEVIDISFQYFHPVAFLSKTTMTELGESPDIAYVSSFLVNVNDQDAFANYFVENQVQCLTVFTNNLSEDLHAIFDTINVMIYIMIGFAFGIGFIILCIMSQNTLLEQKRSVSVLRLIGFTVNDVSKFWSLQSISQMVFALIFAVPAGIGSATLLFLLASSPTQTYPFIFSWPVIAISFGFVLLTVIICHSLAMLSVKRWNLADNTRSRE